MDVRWEFPRFPRAERDAQLLALCSPAPSCLPLTVSADALLARAAELDLFPLAFHRLRRAGVALGEPWQRRFRANAACNLYLRVEQGRLLASLQAAGVPAAPLKGIALAERVYGDPALRAQVDIDLYVPPRRLAAAFHVLSACGYRAASPNGVSPQALARTGDEYTSECYFELGGGPLNVPVELHWRVLPMADRTFEAALRASAEAGCALPAALNFLSLCVRLAADRWRNLKLLADLAHWMARPSFAWQPVVEAARRLRLRRLLAITLMAVRVYFGVAAPAWVREAVSPAAGTSVARAAVVNPFVSSPALAPAATHRLRSSLRESWWDRLLYLARLLRPTASDLARVPLPHGLTFLAWGVRWLRLSGALPAVDRSRPGLSYGRRAA